jgi:hypothetical protein
MSEPSNTSKEQKLEDQMVSPSSLREEAQKLIAGGKMPDLDTLLRTVSSARRKYVPHIMNARKNEALVASAKEKKKAELPEAQAGAPADFGGPVLPNPKGIKVQLDTERPSHPTRLPKGVKFSGDNFKGNVKMDISNPAPNQVEPDPMVPREQ